jgi:hypothetical protein
MLIPKIPAGCSFLGDVEETKNPPAASGGCESWRNFIVRSVRQASAERTLRKDPQDHLMEARNPRKNDAGVDRVCSSIREFGFKIPCLVRSDGEVVDGHLRLKAARKLAITEILVILCDEWTPAQVKAFRLMVNRSVTWADLDEELLALELQEIQESDLDLSLAWRSA